MKKWITAWGQAHTDISRCRPVTFSGSKSLLLRPMESCYSDPIPICVQRGDDLTKKWLRQNERRSHFFKFLF